MSVSAQNLRKSFGALDVLKGIDLDVRAGECVCVLGASGAGKSTLLHVLGLMTPPSGGELRLFGQDAAALSEDQRAACRSEKIGFLFQFHHLLPDLSLLENVMMPLLIRRRPAEEAESEAEKLLKKLGLWDARRRRPSQASGGEQQRAALARALIGNPALVLADEPTGNLDHDNGQRVEDLLIHEARARNAALIIVTHSKPLSLRADRRLLMVDGVFKPEAESQKFV